MQEQKRKKKLVKHGLQLKLTASFLGLAVVAALFQVILLDLSLVRMSAEPGVASQALAERLPSILVGNLAITLCVLIPAMLGFGILITHRIAGPLHRFEEHLRAVARGEDAGTCRIRSGDELGELCETINAAVERLRTRDETAKEKPAAGAPRGLLVDFAGARQSARDQDSPALPS